MISDNLIVIGLGYLVIGYVHNNHDSKQLKTCVFKHVCNEEKYFTYTDNNNHNIQLWKEARSYSLIAMKIMLSWKIRLL